MRFAILAQFLYLFFCGHPSWIDLHQALELLIRQLTAPVKFTQAARELVGKGVTVFVEVGPGNVLSGLLKRIDRGVKTFAVNDLESLNELEDALA